MEETVEGELTILDSSPFVLGEGDLKQHALEVRLRLQELTLGGLVRDVEVATRTGHAMRTLLEEAVRAVAMPEVEELPGLAAGGSTGDNGLPVDEDTDGAQVSGEVPGVGVGVGPNRLSECPFREHLPVVLPAVSALGCDHIYLSVRRGLSS